MRHEFQVQGRMVMQQDGDRMPKAKPSNDEVVQQLRKRLERLRETLYRFPLKGDTPWSAPFKWAIGCLGKKLGYQAWGAIAHHEGWDEGLRLVKKGRHELRAILGDMTFDETEWLFDVCWADCRSAGKARGDWEDLYALPLACEIEWSQNWRATVNDFLRLTVADADIKLFIFACANFRDAQERIELLREKARNVRRFRGEFLVIAVPDGGPFPGQEDKLRAQFAQGAK